MKKQYVTKLYKQRTSMVTSVPLGVREQLELTKESHIVWEVDTDIKFVQISKVVPGVKSHERSKGNYDRKDQGGRA